MNPGSGLIHRTRVKPAEGKRFPLAAARKQLSRVLRPGIGSAPVSAQHFPHALFVALFFVWQAFGAWAGGSGLNIAVVVNQNSTNSVQLGNEFCEKRGVPPQSLFRMTGWTGGRISWTPAEFESYLRDPLLAKLNSAGLTNQIQFVLLSMDIPYRVQNTEGADSTTAALFYGFKTNTIPPPGAPPGCSLPDYSSNSFAFSELPFEMARPNTAPTNSFLVFMLTDDTLAGAQAVLNRALLSDSSFPTQTVYFEKTSDWARSVRFLSFDNAIFDSRLQGDSAVVRISSDGTAFSSLRGLQTGFQNLSLSTSTFVPGALGDSLTSYGGLLFEPNDQTSLLVFLQAGSVASYGTVDEPCAYLQKFPDPLAYFYQARGFCAAESYYLSVLNPYQGLFVGEPLSAPFAARGQAVWQGLSDGAVLSGQIVLPPALFAAADTNLPVTQVDLFIDGIFVRTVTNVPPSPGNVLSVTLNGTPVRYTVPNGATFPVVAAGLADALNNVSNLTRVAVAAAGDRLELQSTDISTSGSNVLLSVGASLGAASALTTGITVAQPNFLDTEATGFFVAGVSNATLQGDWLRADIIRTNGAWVSVSVTNTTANTNIADLCQSLMNAINAVPDLQGPDGALAQDLFPDVYQAQFLIHARSPGWPAAKARAAITSSTNLIVLTPGTNTFEDNLTDLRPRNHVYVSEGLAELPVVLPFDTTRIPDGYHELTLVGYEGTSVRTQTRVSRTVQVRNTSLSATLQPVTGGSVALNVPFALTVSANSGAIARTELFSTGGSLGVISNQQTASFSVPTGLLGIGLHPFFALVTDLAGNQFQTETVNIRVVSSFQIAISSQPLALSWSSTPGVSYDVLSSTNVSGPFLELATVIASAGNVEWPISPPSRQPMFYRVRVTP